MKSERQIANFVNEFLQELKEIYDRIKTPKAIL